MKFLRAPPKRIKQRRVVVTGMGLITPLGNDLEQFWNKLIAGEGAVTNLDSDSHQAFFPNFPISKLPNNIFAPLSPLSSEDQKELSHHEFKELGRFAGMGYLAVKKALNHAHIRPPDNLPSSSPSSSPSSPSDYPSDFIPLSPTRTGVIMGSGIGSLQDIANTDRLLLNDGYRKVSPYFIPKILINLSSGLISKKFGIKGPIGASVLACSTGGDVIAQAFNYIRDGSADVFVAGSSEDSMNHLTICGFSRMRALATNEKASKASRPFDSKRNGFVIGEGAGAIILEDFDHARKRGAKIYAEIRGFGNAGEGYHWSRPSPDAFGAITSMKNAIENSNLLPEHVDYINAHATSTPAGDEIENYAIKEVFGETAKKLAVSSTKGAMGHLLGASGIVEAIISILSIENGIVPPTLNLTTLAEEFNLNYVPNEAQKRTVNVAMSNSFGFGGVNISLLFAKVPDDLSAGER